MRRILTWTIGVVLLTGVAYLLGTTAVAAVKSKAENTSSVRTASPTPKSGPVDLSGLNAHAKVSPPTEIRGTETSTLTMSWWSLGNAGSLGGTAPYTFGGQGGQTAIGHGEAAGVRLGSGFWYGARVCSCTRQGDSNNDGNLDALDLNDMIDALFFGGENPKDRSCPTLIFDLDCSMFADALDLNYLVDYIFFGGQPPCQPCD